jgi:hypothetical protein
VTHNMEFPFGAEVECDDGMCGYLRALVVDPVADTVTYLIVGPEHGWGVGRLVPVDLVEATGAQERAERGSRLRQPRARRGEGVPAGL